MHPPPRAPRRLIVHAEALAWLAAHPAEPGSSVVTSMPDLTETPGLDLAAWRAWTVEAARTVLRWVPDDGVTVFFQSDIVHRGVWIDKGYLASRAAEAEGASLVWHRIACRAPAGTATQGRAGYSHLLCFSRQARGVPARPEGDVLPDVGHKPWSKAMGVEACLAVCRYLLAETPTRTVVDPFCGRGTVLAVANALGLDAIGVDVGLRKCRAARRLVVETAGEPEAQRGADGSRAYSQGALSLVWEKRGRRAR
ncbi:MAG: SAM-dependent methyltransferase [Myxococcales bacterium]|nr:SAM-dependent methyltransferase [Myxococcales bacterium]